MFHRECWAKMKNGVYWYKNGVKVVREGRTWVVYYASGKAAFRSDTLKACKDFVGERFK